MVREEDESSNGDDNGGNLSLFTIYLPILFPSSPVTPSTFSSDGGALDGLDDSDDGGNCGGDI